MSVFKVSNSLGKWMTCAASAAFLALASAGAAQAVPVRVDYSATVTPGVPGPSPGTGTVSGTLGVFDVTMANEVFDLPGDGSLSVETAGFASGFPNGSFPLTVLSGGVPIGFSFDSIGPTASDFSGSLAGVDGLTFLQTAPVPCSLEGIDTSCFVRLLVGGVDDEAQAFFLGLGGELPPFSAGPLEFSFTLLDEPTDFSLPNSFLLLAGGLVAVGALRRKTQR